jgi:hypothetical protein
MKKKQEIFIAEELGNALKCDFCGTEGIHPNLDTRLYKCKCGAIKSF